MMQMEVCHHHELNLHPYTWCSSRQTHCPFLQQQHAWPSQEKVVRKQKAGPLYHYFHTPNVGCFISSFILVQGLLLINTWLLAFWGTNSFSGKKNSTFVIPIMASALPFAICPTMYEKGQIGILLSWYFNLVASFHSHGISMEFLFTITKWPSVTGRFNKFLKNMQATFIFQWTHKWIPWWKGCWK